MKIQQVSTSGTSTSLMIPFNLNSPQFNVGIGAIVTGSANYTVQYTMDDINSSSYNSASGVWFNYDSSVLVAATANKTGSFQFPVMAARVQQNSGTGSTLTSFIQQGI